jgi:hypothetical protein
VNVDPSQSRWKFALNLSKKISRMIYCPVNDNGTWRKRYNSELYTFYSEPDIVEVVKIGRFRWLGKLSLQKEGTTCRKT